MEGHVKGPAFALEFEGCVGIWASILYDELLKFPLSPL